MGLNGLEIIRLGNISESYQSYIIMLTSMMKDRGTTTSSITTPRYSVIKFIHLDVFNIRTYAVHRYDIEAMSS